MQRLRRLGDEEFVRSMIELFFSYVSQKLAEARRALEEGDLNGVGSAAHAIKSTAGNAGACRVQEVAARLEQVAKGGDGDQVRALLPQLEQSFSEVTPLLEAEKAKLDGRND
jgi:HPt (histidine-containing phosphotransfer) domain-containing protein